MDDVQHVLLWNIKQRNCFNDGNQDAPFGLSGACLNQQHNTVNVSTPAKVHSNRCLSCSKMNLQDYEETRFVSQNWRNNSKNEFKTNSWSSSNKSISRNMLLACLRICQYAKDCVRSHNHATKFNQRISLSLHCSQIWIGHWCPLGLVELEKVMA